MKIQLQVLGYLALLFMTAACSRKDREIRTYPPDSVPPVLSGFFVANKEYFRTPPAQKTSTNYEMLLDMSSLPNSTIKKRIVVFIAILPDSNLYENTSDPIYNFDQRDVGGAPFEMKYVSDVFIDYK